MAGGKDPLSAWKASADRAAANYSTGISSMARASAFMDAMDAMKGSLGANTVADRYERLREQYVTDKIDLEEFAAGVTELLLGGL